MDRRLQRLVIKPGPRIEKKRLTKLDSLVFFFAILLKICFALALSQWEKSRSKIFPLSWLSLYTEAVRITTICSLSLAAFH